MKRQTNPNSLANLKPIQPGEVRNPDGMRKGTLHFKTLLKKALESKHDQVTFYRRDHNGEVMIDSKTGMPIVDKIVNKADAIVIKLIELALEGDLQAIREVINRVDGMPVQEIKTTDENTFGGYDVEILGSKSPLLQRLNGTSIVDVESKESKPHPKTASQKPANRAKRIVKRRVVRKKGKK